MLPKIASATFAEGRNTSTKVPIGYSIHRSGSRYLHQTWLACTFIPWLERFIYTFFFSSRETHWLGDSWHLLWRQYSFVRAAMGVHRHFVPCFSCSLRCDWAIWQEPCATASNVISLNTVQVKRYCFSIPSCTNKKKLGSNLVFWVTRATPFSMAEHPRALFYGRLVWWFWSLARTNHRASPLGLIITT